MNPNYYNRLSKEYDSLYIKNINAYQKSKIANSSTDDYFVDFYPSLGIKETQQTDLLIYGQAVNGWNSGFNLSEVYEQNKLEASVFASNKYHYEQNHSPLDWVNARWSKSIFEDFCEDELSQEFYKGTYFAYRSFFWNVAFKLVSDYYGFERSSWNWSKNLVWSNLYKIAPEDANPNLNERKLQEPGSINLVRKEIEEVNPKFCIVLTNLEWWLPFQVGLRTTNLISDDIPDNIVSIEKYNNTNIIVTSRPRFANSDNFTAKILQIINSLK
jgi:hypothetical protein